MIQAPEFYESVRQRAAERWDQLENDPELAGPWRQLFKQVQSPRHILSELLQNADDAGATEAAVRITDQTFIFEHNGEDFSEEHFASLCRFGYSNKKSLHTIGFRGIGFKSTFSLGDCVKLFTPSLSVCFFQKRFTEPHWVGEAPDTLGRTRVSVEIADGYRQKQVEKNLGEWLKSPVSLLFFKSIRRLRIGERELHWGSMGPGPLANSEWMAFNENTGKDYLLIRSDAETFPDGALEEIRQERLLGIDDETDFPSCTIEIVLGAKGRLYVVLPTGVQTELPFACNAPFIQDPARLKIKDLETSPTNRWLLERIGRLAASTMLRWLNQTDLPTVERAPGYGLLPDVDWDETSLKGECGTVVEKSFKRQIDGQPLLVTEDGSVTPENASIAIPAQLCEVWPADHAARLLDDESRPALCQHIVPEDCDKLVNWGLVDKLDKQTFLQTLQRKHLPKPETWQNLLKLWAYLAPDITGWRSGVNTKDIRIVPVQGKDVLYAASDIVRLGEKKLLHSDDDWEFLAKYLIVLNQNWPRFLAEQRRNAVRLGEESETESIDAAYSVLAKLGMDRTSDASAVIDRFSSHFFSRKTIYIKECVRLSQIAAKLRSAVNDSFKFVTVDDRLRSAKSGVLFDADGRLETLLPEQTQASRILHSEYSVQYSSCSHEDWMQWISSGRSGLGTFVQLVKSRNSLGRHRAMEQLLRARGSEGALKYRYTDPWFYLEDWDFEEADWEHWRNLGSENPAIWSEIAKRIFSQKPAYWQSKASAQIIERASNGHERRIRYLKVTPLWVHRLRNRPCLPDTHGIRRKPDELLRRTPETEPLLDVEPFVHGSLDREATRPLLDLMGVQSTAARPDRLLRNLQALAASKDPPIHEVVKWYRRLDLLIDSCTTEGFEKIRRAFQSEKLILTQNGIWESAAGVFLVKGEEDVPDAEVVRDSAATLTLWRKIGVADRPTVELAIEWLGSLPANKPLSPDELRRARSLLSRYPIRCWDECGHWLNLAGEWVPADGFRCSLTKQSGLSWGHFHQWLKRATADLRRLPSEVTGDPPFSHLPTLETQVEERLDRSPHLTRGNVSKKWLTTVGSELRRVEYDSEDDTQRVRNLATKLANTEWCNTSGIAIIPYIEGKPAGTSRRTDVLWFNGLLFVADLPTGKQARRVPEEIGKAFGRSDIKAALDYSFNRDPEEIREYLEANFKLCPLNAIPGELVVEAQPHSTDQGEPHVGDDTDQVDQGSEQTQHPVAQRVASDGEGDIDSLGASITEDESRVDLDYVEKAPKPRPKPKPAKPSLIERFAASQGYDKESKDRYTHDNGGWIARANGDRFPWERRRADGTLTRYLLPKNHCLEREPLQIEADVWELIERHSETYALVLTNVEGHPVEIDGSRLRAMRKAGRITLFPATYRLVYSDDRSL